MTSPKTFKRYASQWFTLFEEFKQHPTKVVTVHCPNRNRAMAMRLEFYKAREAFLSDEGLRGEYEAALNNREVRISNESDVLFDLKDNNWIGQLIDKSLNKEEGKV